MKRIVAKTHKAIFPSRHNDYQPLILRPKNLFILAVILLVLKFLVFSWFFYYPKTSQFAVVTSSELIELANQERVAKGLPALKLNDKLVQAAQQKAQDMLINNYFAHTSPLGVTPWHWFDVVGYNYVAAGENLAKDFTDSQFLHQAWMNSPSHRDNILNNNYQEIGIAVVEGEMNGGNTVLAVQMFGKVAAAATTPKETKKPEVKQPTPAEVGSVSPEQEITTPSVGGTAVSQPPQTKNVLTTTNEKSEPVVNDIYFIIAGFLALVLLLTIFINIRVQYPKLIFTSIAIILLIAAIASFNSQAFLNSGIDII